MSGEPAVAPAPAAASAAHPRVRPLDALGLGLAVLTCVIWGTNGLGAKVGSATLPPWTLAACTGWAA